MPNNFADYDNFTFRRRRITVISSRKITKQKLLDWESNVGECTTTSHIKRGL